MRLLSAAALISCVTTATYGGCPPCPTGTGPCVITNPDKPETNYCEKGFQLQIQNGEVSIKLTSPDVLKRLEENFQKR